MGASLIWKTIVGVSAPVVVWLGSIVLVLIPWVQRQILYLHQAPMSWGEKLHIPESFGFLKNQVAPFYITTPDGIKLFTWLIAPLNVYAGNEEQFLIDHELPDPDVELSAAFRFLKQDSQSRLVIYFHGNSATIGQKRRTDEYRVLSSGAAKIVILTFDYRGFGLSTGSPTESGVTTDAISVVQWALDVAKIPPSRIVLLGQSLGTAVATAAAEHFILQSPKIEFAAIMLCAAFTDAANVFLDFSIARKINVMAPLKLHSSLTNWFRNQYKDRWMTSSRLATIAEKSDRLRLTLLHATGDNIIPWRHCEDLFYVVANVVYGGETTRAEIDDRRETTEYGEGGWLCVAEESDKRVKQRIVKYGGHDAIMKWGPVALLLQKCFEED